MVSLYPILFIPVSRWAGSTAWLSVPCPRWPATTVTCTTPGRRSRRRSSTPTAGATSPSSSSGPSSRRASRTTSGRSTMRSSPIKVFRSIRAKWATRLKARIPQTRTATLAPGIIAMSPNWMKLSLWYFFFVF